MSIWDVRDTLEKRLLDVPELMRSTRARVHVIAFDLALVLDDKKMIERPFTRWQHFKACVLGD